MKHLVPQNLAKLGHDGWTSMPRWNSQWSWTLISSLIMGVGIGALAQPQLAVRFMTVKSGKQLNRAVLVGSVFILCTAGIAYVVGALANVWFYRHGHGIAIEAAGGNADLIIPRFIDMALPKVFVYIFMLTLLSAAMSTLSSLVHVNGSSLGYDLGRTISGDKIDSKKITRIGMILGILGSIAVAYTFPPGIVARGTAIFFGVCAAAFLPAYTAALYWKRATRAGVWASVITGAAVSTFGLAFLHISESKVLGISRWLCGRDVLITAYPWPFVDTLCYALPLSAAALVVVSLLTKAPDPEHIRKCFDQK
jgi:SSS family solute:Na+ symporter